MITREYIIGRLWVRHFRNNLTFSKVSGEFVEDWAETKGLFESRFALKATPEYHEAIRRWMEKVNA